MLGHGPVGQADLDGMDEYINTLNALVREARKQGVSVDEIDNIADAGQISALDLSDYIPRKFEVPVSDGNSLVN